MKPLLVPSLVLLLASLSGCMVPCGNESPRLPGIHNSPYCAQQEAEVKNARYRAEDVTLCVQQGGDPAACRAAIYGANRNTVNVQVGR
jgi:hypothetical protein